MESVEPVPPLTDDLLADTTLTGAPWCAQRSREVDTWLASLYAAAAGTDRAGMALVATGGYGRGELCPYSDLDVMLVHRGQADAGDIAERIWYPTWDAGVKLGHSLTTVKQATELARVDLDTATTLLSARAIAGDAVLADDLRDQARRAWQQRGRAVVEALDERVRARHDATGEIAFVLEPDLKEGRGGLRDVQSIHWALMAMTTLPAPIEIDDALVEESYRLLLAARVELHRHTRRPVNTLALQDQDAVASALGRPDADALMSDIARAARGIAWSSDEAWRQLRGVVRRSRLRFRSKRSRVVGAGLAIVDGELHLDPSIDVDGLAVLHVARTAAECAVAIAPGTRARLAAVTEPLPEPWPDAARESFVALLRTGGASIPVIETLDHIGAWAALVPEWDAVRSRPQRNPYHRYTVDRHALEAVARAAPLTTRVDRPDVLVVAALLHDIGKCGAGDHIAVGVDITQVVARRMGFGEADVALLEELVANHLLLSEVATRRDLDDPATARSVAARVSSPGALALLAALTEADSLATGPTAWGPAKAQLVTSLVAKVDAVLRGDDVPPASESRFPTEDQLAALAQPGTHVDASANRLVVMTDDRTGVFSKVAGVLALHGIDITAAFAYSSPSSRALSEFHVVDPFRDPPPWEKITPDLERALHGRLALHARVTERAARYANRPSSRAALGGIKASVRFDNSTSDTATIIDVHAPDSVGLLYRVTHALVEFELDVRSAHVQTLGPVVADAFYVVDRHGAKIDDPHTQAEIQRAILAVVQ